jgi:Calcineurin-like phosphoesterase
MNGVDLELEYEQAATAVGGQYRILHLSDPHFASRASRAGWGDLGAFAFDFFVTRRIVASAMASHAPVLAKFAALFAHSQTDVLDAIILTGDIATTGARSDLETARRYFDPAREMDVAVSKLASPVGGAPLPRRLAKSIPLTLGDVELDRHLLPGNHDRYDTQHPFCIPGCTDFDAVFSGYWRPSARVQTLRVDEKPGSFPLVVIAADLCLPKGDSGDGLFAHLGQGRVEEAVLDSLRLETTRHRETRPTAGIVWALHFPPSYPNLRRPLQLLNGAALLDLASEMNVEHIFAGHTHRAMQYVPDGYSCTVHCAGTFAQHGAQKHSVYVHGINVDIEQRVTVTSCEYRFDDVHLAFRPDFSTVRAWNTAAQRALTDGA